MKNLFRVLSVITLFICFAESAKADENTTMWVGDSYTNTGQGTVSTVRYDAGFFKLVLSGDKTTATITLTNPFEGTKEVQFYRHFSNYGYNTVVVVTCNQVDVELYPTQLSLKVGETRTLEWQFSRATNPEPQIAFSSSNLSVADVDFNGKITAKSPGTATITATTNYGTTATCEVTVLGLTLDQLEAEMHAGEQLRLTATMLPTGEPQRVTWSSSDPTVAKVVGGVVYALEWGECVVTATTIDGSNLSANCLISVQPGQAGPTGKRGDLTNDDVVDVSDVNALIDIVLGK